MKFLVDNLNRDKVTFARNGFAERSQNSQRVSVRSPMGTPHDRGAGNVLTKEGGKVRAKRREFGLVSGLRADMASLLSMRGTDRDVDGGAGVAQGGGEDVGRSVPRMRPGTSISAVQCPPRSRSRGRRLCPGIRSGRQHKARVPLAQADRVDRHLGLHHSTVVRVQAPHPRVIDLGVPEFLRGPLMSPRARASVADLDARSCPRNWW